MRLPFTPHGIKELLIVSLCMGVAAVVGLTAFPVPWNVLAAILSLAGLAFTCSFFRDPERRVTDDAHLVVSPADGTVADIEQVEHPLVGVPAWRIGIFLSVFNVHVNRAPLAGRVVHVEHRPGRFLDARDPAATTENEAQDVVLEVADSAGAGYRVLVRQISGLIARRIVCRARVGQELARGERFGMIKFGSRTELFLPLDRVEGLRVELGQKLRGGQDVLARLASPVVQASVATEAASP